MDCHTPEKEASQGASQSKRDEPAEARVDISKLSIFLHSQQFNPSKIICSIVHSQSLHLFLDTEDTSIHYYQPAVLL